MALTFSFGLASCHFACVKFFPDLKKTHSLSYVQNLHLSLSLFYYDKNVYTVFYWYLRAYYTLIAHMQKSHYRTIFFQLILVTTLKRIMKYYRLAGVSQTTAKLNEIVCLTKTNLAQIAFVTFCFNRDNKKVGKNPLFSWSKLGNFTRLLKRIAVILF